ncbi:MAG: hypothetical protein JSS82_12800 [Bacteroidetes bacterium]|nr:hypothetical protein [Bacteroidota bacterium]
MNRLILNNFKASSQQKIPDAKLGDTEELIRLSSEMKNYLKEAAADLLQPRPEAVAQLLKKSLVIK